MQPFQFTRAQNREAAIKALGGNNAAKFIGGGTNLIDLMKFGIENPSGVVDINALDLQQVEMTPGGGVKIGALVRNSDLAYNPIIRDKYPVLSEALLSGASPQLRNMATVGGNLMQRTRCPYFYDINFVCNKRQPGSGCAAMHGYNRSHAILGTSDKCIATHPSDMCVAMVALDAIVHVQGASGTRKIPIREFHVVPGDTPEIETTLVHGELITAVELPAMSFATRSTYLKVRDRASYEFALASAAVILDIQQGKIRDARVAFGGIGTKPWRSTRAEKALIGSSASEGTYNVAAEEALKKATGFKYNSFKIELAKRTLVRALSTAGGII